MNSQCGFGIREKDVSSDAQSTMLFFLLYSVSIQTAWASKALPSKAKVAGSIPTASVLTLYYFQEIEAKHVIYTDGCIVTLKWWINDHLHIIGGLGFAFACVQVLHNITEKRRYREETRGKLCHADIFSLLTIENYINSLFYYILTMQRKKLYIL